LCGAINKENRRWREDENKNITECSKVATTATDKKMK
jgi:hypothetical protein